MFLVEAKTLFVESLRGTFNADYPVDKFKSLWCSIEYPNDEANYPGIWVDFTPTAQVASAGINHEEYTDPLDPDNKAYPIVRYNFAGSLDLTVVALTSLERDLLTDEVSKVIAFGKDYQLMAFFHDNIADNDLLNVRAQWDKFSISGTNETGGTPWGSNEIIYEATVSMDMEGDFAYLPATGELVLLSAIEIFPYLKGTTPPLSGGGWQ